MLLTETWLDNDENVSIPNFTCVVKYKRPNIRAGGVAIYHNECDALNIDTPHFHMSAINSTAHTVSLTEIGDISLSKCKLSNGKEIVIAAIYISPNQKLDDIMYFIQSSLLMYTHGGAALLGRGDDEIPLILGGDFNVNFAEDASLPLLHFLREKFGLDMNNDRNIATTKSGTTIDAIFSRNLHHLESRTYVSYFSYHKAIISATPLPAPIEDNVQIEEIN